MIVAKGGSSTGNPLRLRVNKPSKEKGEKNEEKEKNWRRLSCYSVSWTNSGALTMF
jgi:hypothetical protein